MIRREASPDSRADNDDVGRGPVRSDCGAPIRRAQRRSLTAGTTAAQEQEAGACARGFDEVASLEPVSGVGGDSLRSVAHGRCAVGENRVRTWLVGRLTSN